MSEQTNLFGEITLGGDLAATATHRHRSWSWIPVDPAEGYAGKLLITMQQGKRLGSKAEQCEYAVELLPVPVGFIGRRFHLSHLGEKAEVYEVLVGLRPGEGTCNCPAGQYNAPTCKHRDALRAAIMAGAFEGMAITEQAEPVAPSGPWVRRVE